MATAAAIEAQVTPAMQTTRTTPVSPAQMVGRWMAALERARQHHIRVLSGPALRRDGALCWRVSSASEPEYPHLVVQDTDGALTCSCPAGEQPGLICQHRAVVLGQLLAQALIGAAGNDRRVAVVRAPRRVRRPVPFSSPGARRLAVAVLEQPPANESPAASPAHAPCTPRETPLLPSHPGETALLRRDNRPFSERFMR